MTRLGPNTVLHSLHQTYPPALHSDEVDDEVDSGEALQQCGHPQEGTFQETQCWAGLADAL